MARTFDVGIESLVSKGAPEAAGHQPVGRQPASSAGLPPLPFVGRVAAMARLRQGSRFSWRLSAAK